MLFKYDGKPVEADSVLCADALDVLPVIPDGSIQVIVTDPPYNVSLPGAMIERPHAKPIRYDYGEWDHGKIDWRDYIGDLVRILKPNGTIVIFYSRQEIGDIARSLVDDYNMRYRTMGTWVKTNPTPMMPNVKRWQNGTEHFLVMTKNHDGSHHFDTSLPQSPDYFMHDVSFKPRWHPTQKPLALMKWIISYWSLPGDLIFDPFAGSGTTLVAAKLLGRRYLGVEISPEYCKIIQERLRGTPKPLF